MTSGRGVSVYLSLCLAFLLGLTWTAAGTIRADKHTRILQTAINEMRSHRGIKAERVELCRSAHQIATEFSVAATYAMPGLSFVEVEKCAGPGHSIRFFLTVDSQVSPAMEHQILFKGKGLVIVEAL